MSVDVGLDIEAIELLDFDFAPPCESGTDKCDRAAEWRAVLKCCGLVVLFCDGHMQDKFKNMKNSRPWYCGTKNGCMEVLPPGNPYSLVERI